MDAKLVFFKSAFNIFICQSYCGVWFAPFTLFPEFPILGFQDFSWSLEFFVLKDVYLCIVAIQESYFDTLREGGQCVRFVFVRSYSWWYVESASNPADESVARSERKGFSAEITVDQRPRFLVVSGDDWPKQASYEKKLNSTVQTWERSLPIPLL